jgi:hypothetical protein
LPELLSTGKAFLHTGRGRIRAGKMLRLCHAVRYVGIGHSWVDVVPPRISLMSLVHTGIVAVDYAACARVAGWIAARDIPRDVEETALPGLSSVEIGDFYLFLVAICHQTSPLGEPPLLGTVNGRLRRGWDYLLGRFEQVVSADHHVLSIAVWREMTGDKLAEMFADSQFGRRLVETDRRAELVRDLATVMGRRGWHHAHDIYETSAGRVASGHPNLLELLGEFTAYRDPVRKKSFYLLSLMKNNGIWKYHDPESVGAPVDYHEVRGHLRLGTVRIRSHDLYRKIVSRQPVDEEEDLAIRNSVFEAIMEINRRSGINDPSRLHYLFWNVFRACCTRDAAHCQACPPDCALPERYVPLALDDDHRACPFRSVCDTAAEPSRLELVEQIVDKAYDFH